MGVHYVQPVIAGQLKARLLCRIYMPDIVYKRGCAGQPGNFFFLAAEDNIREPRREYFIYPFRDFLGPDKIRD